MTDVELMAAMIEWQDREDVILAQIWERIVVETAAKLIEAAEAQKTAEQQGPESP
jgi:hypothetical protein